MELTVTEIENDARVRLGQASATNSRWSSTIFLRWINEAIEKIVIKTHCLIDTRIGYSIANRWEYPLPSDALSIRALWYADKILIRKDNIWMNEHTDWKTDITADIYTKDSVRYWFPHRTLSKVRTIGIYRASGVSGEKIELEIVKSPVAMTASGDSPEIPPEFHKTVIPYICYLARLDSGKKDEAGIFLSEFKSEIEEAIKLSGGSDSSDPIQFGLGGEYT